MKTGLGTDVTEAAGCRMLTLPSLTFLAMIRFALLLSLIVFTSCSSTPSAREDGATFVVVRHAEKATDDPDNPNLSDIGRARAQRLAAKLAHTDLIAVLVTEFRRTHQTAQPTADAHGLPLTRYYAKGPANEIAARWRNEYRRGTVLVVGHSNTVPDLVSALSGRPAEAMTDEEYDRLTQVHMAADGTIRVEIGRY